MTTGHQILLVIEQSDDTLWGRVEHGNFLGTTSANTSAEIIKNLLDSIADYLKHEGSDDEAWNGITIDNLELTLAYDLQSFFDAHPEIKITAIADRAGMNASLVRQYSAGIKHPSKEQAKKIEDAIHKLGKELSEMRILVEA